MSLMLFPNKTNPQAWRVQDKVLEEQRYFYFTSLGKRNAKILAEKYHRDLMAIRLSMKKRSLLPVNRIFNGDGTIKGLFKRRVGKYDREDHDYYIFQITNSTGARCAKTLSIDCRDHEVAWKIMVRFILKSHNIKTSSALNEKFVAASNKYRKMKPK